MFVKISAKFSVFLVFCLLLMTPGCIHRTKTISRKVKITHDRLEELKSKKEIGKQSTSPMITIWVHGTRLLPSPIFRSYIYCESGLHHANELPPTYFLSQLANAMIQSDPSRYNHENFYLFGWSGNLDAAIRMQAAKELYSQLYELRLEYEKKYKTKPKIRLITHSHGGNVVLNLVKFNKYNDLIIDELILLACPVQASTKHYLHSLMFKKIYAFYSSLDLMQILAPQFYWCTDENFNPQKHTLKFPPTSSRLFSNQPNLIQVKFKMNGHAIMHTEFSSACFTQYLPLLLDELDAWQFENPQYLDKPLTKRLLKIITP